MNTQSVSLPAGQPQKLTNLVRRRLCPCAARPAPQRASAWMGTRREGRSEVAASRWMAESA